MVTVCTPSSAAATKSALSSTLRFTVNGAVGAGTAVSVNAAAVPSVTGDVPAAMVTRCGASSSTTCTVCGAPSRLRPPPEPVLDGARASVP